MGKVQHIKNLERHMFVVNVEKRFQQVPNTIKVKSILDQQLLDVKNVD